KTEYIDLYQNHYDDEVTPVEETLEAFTSLIKQGKVRWIGASNITPERFTESLKASEKNGFARYETLQPLYNLYEREDFEQKFEKICVDNNIGVLNYYALASGFLTGKYRSTADFGKSQRGGGMNRYLNEKGEKLLAALDIVSKKHEVTPAAIALAWLISRPSVTAPIASATKTSQIDSFVTAASLKLSAEDLELLNKN
ncbi:MAG: aldo/keto reductase, partial [Flavitalea sp.]